MEFSSTSDVKGGEAPKKDAPHPLFESCTKNEFKIVSLAMKDAEKGEVLWKQLDWDLEREEEIKVEFPKDMLKCKAIGREIVFYSKH